MRYFIFPLSRISIVLFFFFFNCSGDHRDLHSFPTRRSSELRPLALDDAEEARVIEVAGRDELAKSIRAVRRPVADRKSTRLNSSHLGISYAVFCLKKKKQRNHRAQETTVNIHRRILKRRANG